MAKQSIALYLTTNTANPSKILTVYFVFFLISWHRSGNKAFYSFAASFSKTFFLVFHKMLNFQNVFFFVYKWRTKSIDGYQIGSGISPDTRPTILCHVVHFSQ